MGIFDLIGGLVGAGANLFGGEINAQAQQNINNQNIAEQEKFAQNGIQWKVDDARKAGINPLAALGASTSSFSNVVGSDALGSGVAAAGQNVARAIQSTQSADDRAFQDANRALQLQHGQLENDLLASQLRTQNQPGNGPPTPTSSQRYAVEGQGPTVIGGTSAQSIRVRPSEATAASPRDDSLEAAAGPSVKLVRQGDNWLPMPSKEYQGSTFGSDSAGWIWDVSNRWLPTIGYNQHPPHAPPEGMQWDYNPLTGYSLIKKSTARYQDLNPFWATPAY